MSKEISVTGGLAVRRVSSTNGVVQTDYQSRPNKFVADQVNLGGPTPSEVFANVAGFGGTDIDLSQLTTPGFARFMNMDDTNFVRWGVRDTATGVFYPAGKLLPGEFAILRLDDQLGKDEPGTGTGFTGTTKLHFRADTQKCKVLVEVFEA